MKSRITLIILLLSLCCFTTRSHDNDSIPLLTVIGHENFGVADIESGVIVVDTVYQAVEIINGNILQCLSDRYTVNGTEIMLPGYVVEVFNTDGNMIYRSCDNLLSADRAPYTRTIEYARYKGYKEVEAAAKFKAAMDHENNGRRREAFQAYVAAYKLCPEIKIAKERALEIKAQIDGERSLVQSQLDAEEAQRRLEAEQRAAAWSAIAGALNSTAAALNQIQAVQQQSKRTSSASVAVAGSESVSESRSSSSSSSSSSSRSSDRNRKSSKTSSKSSSSSGWSFLEDDGKCTLCLGSKTCNFCHNGKVLGYAVRTCDYCHGSNVCQRCKGTGKSK